MMISYEKIKWFDSKRVQRGIGECVPQVQLPMRKMIMQTGMKGAYD
jgi:hypothetical protein